ncbi:MAG: hypothetical protein AAFU80_04495 [Pseudomonadota bacterium]
MSDRRRRLAQRERRTGWITASLYLFFFALLAVVAGPVLADRLMGALKAGGECRILRVVDADTYRLDCEVIGRQQAQLLGANAPATREVGCRAEYLAGMRAKWAARRMLWGADEIVARIDGFGWDDRTLVILRLDGEGMASRLVEQGHAMQDAGYSTQGWCAGELDGRMQDG